ncbi:MAG: hypothetical protein WCH34_03225 [Bacteroidota bacterium]
MTSDPSKINTFSWNSASAKKNRIKASLCAKMCVCYYYRVIKGEAYWRKIIIEQYIDLHKTYNIWWLQKKFDASYRSIKNYIRTASLLYLKHYDLTKRERNSIQYVLDNLNETEDPAEINRLMTKAYNATKRFPEDTPITWD